MKTVYEYLKGFFFDCLLLQEKDNFIKAIGILFWLCIIFLARSIYKLHEMNAAIPNDIKELMKQL